MVELGLLIPLFAASMLMAIVFPVILMLVVKFGLKTNWTPLGVGAGLWFAAMFRFIPLYMVLIPLSFFFAENWIFALFSIFLLALAAGICEEVARYLAFTKVIKKFNSWENSVMYGVGHGGAESVMIGVGIGFNILYVLALMYWDLSFMLSGEEITDLKEVFTSLAWYEALMGGVERILTVVFHIGMSVLVYQAVRYRTKSYLLLAIMLHFLVNFIAVLIALYYGVVPAEIAIAVFAFLGILIVFLFKSKRRMDRG